jgi:hypothetical protein
MNLIKTVSLGDIRADASAQPRASLLTDKVSEYAERMTEGDAFPPMVVFFDGKIYWLADGFHRYHAAVRMDLANFPCDVRDGSLRDAVLFSCGANAAHGVPRTNEDKRRAVTKILNDSEWSGWTDSETARRCAVTHPFVGKLRASLVTVTCERPSEDDVAPRTYITKHGTIATMNTANIGGKRPLTAVPARAADSVVTASCSAPTEVKPADAAEVAGLANAVRMGLAALDPALDRIIQVGLDAFWLQASEQIRRQVISSAESLQVLAATAPRGTAPQQ